MPHPEGANVRHLKFRAGEVLGVLSGGANVRGANIQGADVHFPLDNRPIVDVVVCVQVPGVQRELCSAVSYDCYLADDSSGDISLHLRLLSYPRRGAL